MWGARGARLWRSLERQPERRSHEWGWSFVRASLQQNMVVVVEEAARSSASPMVVGGFQPAGGAEWVESVRTVDLMSKSHHMASQRRFLSSGDDKAPVAPDPRMRATSSLRHHSILSAIFSEKEFHSIANETLDHLQEKIEAYGEDLDVDGFDLDYSDGVMTVQLGDLGTYVINKQTPNCQLWLSSPVSGPARFDWTEHAWVYRRNKVELISLLEKELSNLLGASIDLKS